MACTSYNELLRKYDLKLFKAAPFRGSLTKDKVCLDGEWHPRFVYRLREDAVTEDELEMSPSSQYLEFLKQAEQWLRNCSSLTPYRLKDYKGTDAAGNIPKLQRYVKEFSEKFNSASLYFWSKFNATQKSTTAKAIIEELKDLYAENSLSEFQGEFVVANVLMNDLKNEDYDEKSAERVKQYLAADLLVIDDAFAKDKVTLYKSGYQISFLDSFLRDRIDYKKKATIFTSNIPVSEIAPLWGTSLGSLVDRAVYEMEFKDIIGKDIPFDSKKIFD